MFILYNSWFNFNSEISTRENLIFGMMIRVMSHKKKMIKIPFSKQAMLILDDVIWNTTILF